MREKLQAIRTRVGRRVGAFRRLRGLSQEELAELVGNTAVHIGLIERGKANVTLDILTAIATSLSVDVSELFYPTSRQARGAYTITQQELDQVESALRAVERVKVADTRHAAPRQPRRPLKA